MTITNSNTVLSRLHSTRRNVPLSLLQCLTLSATAMQMSTSWTHSSVSQLYWCWADTLLNQGNQQSYVTDQSSSKQFRVSFLSGTARHTQNNVHRCQIASTGSLLSGTERHAQDNVHHCQTETAQHRTGLLSHRSGTGQLTGHLHHRCRQNPPFQLQSQVMLWCLLHLSLLTCILLAAPLI